MACFSRIKVAAYIFEWYRESVYAPRGTSIKSEPFYAGTERESTWRMDFYPYGDFYVDDRYSSFNLTMVHGSSVTASGKVNIIYKDNVILEKTMYEKVFKENDSWTFSDFMKRSDIPYPMIIRCELNILEDKKCLPYVNRVTDFSQVVTDIHSMLTRQTDTDVSIVTQDKKELLAHKLVLAARSEVFAAMFQNDMAENLQGKIEISDMEGGDVEQMLQYIYSGNLTEWSLALCMNLFVAGDKYKINGLKEACSLYMQKNMTSDHAAKILTLADMHNDELLKQTALDFLTKNAKSVLSTPDWKIMVQEKPHLVDELVMKMADKS